MTDQTPAPTSAASTEAKPAEARAPAPAVTISWSSIRRAAGYAFTFVAIAGASYLGSRYGAPASSGGGVDQGLRNDIADAKTASVHADSVLTDLAQHAAAQDEQMRAQLLAARVGKPAQCPPVGDAGPRVVGTWAACQGGKAGEQVPCVALPDGGAPVSEQQATALCGQR